jgi:Na+:H+ antiporter, NhaA family
MSADQTSRRSDAESTPSLRRRWASASSTAGAGKPLDAIATAFLLAKFTHASLNDDPAWRDVLGVSLLAGIGVTVSLSIGELAFGHGTAAGRRRHDRRARRVRHRRCTGFLGSLSRNAGYRRIEAVETLDADHDGVPDIYASRRD